MQSLTDQERGTILAENPGWTAADIDAVERLLAERMAIEPEEPESETFGFDASRKAPRRALIEARLDEIHDRLSQK
ncbi:MAG TPA: hypothetical protein VEU30_06300 [Thermoanaerobaculia bacterium]|jgi:hypothetical protein|nr:hypothetical protein [Thermoanaerobaculia bacterium]